MSDDIARLNNAIANKESLLQTETNPQRIQEINNEIHGLEITVQEQIAQNVGEEPPA